MALSRNITFIFKSILFCMSEFIHNINKSLSDPCYVFIFLLKTMLKRDRHILLNKNHIPTLSDAMRNIILFIQYYLCYISNSFTCNWYPNHVNFHCNLTRELSPLLQISDVRHLTSQNPLTTHSHRRHYLISWDYYYAAVYNLTNRE